MSKETKCIVAGLIGSGLMGAAIGTTVRNCVLPKCNDVSDKLIVTLGTGIIGFTAGGVFAEQWYSFCDNMFGTNIVSKEDEEEE